MAGIARRHIRAVKFMCTAIILISEQETPKQMGNDNE
jgi:hypothetical protein